VRLSFLGAFAVFTIGIRSEPFDNFSRLVAQRTAAEEKPAKLAVTPPKPDFDLELLPGSQSCLEYFQITGRLSG
jgi:hypothetical protein